MGVYDYLAGSGVVNAGIASPSSTSRYRISWATDVFDADLNNSAWAARIKKLPWKNAEGGSPYFMWDEEALWPLTVTTNGTATSAVGQTIALTSGQGARVTTRSVLINKNTGEQMLVTEVSTDTLTLGQRGMGGTAAAAIGSGDVLQVLLTSRADNSVKVESRTRGRTNYQNCLQVASATLAMTKHMKGWKLKEGKNFSEWDRQMKIVEADFQRKMVGDFFLKYGMDYNSSALSGNLVLTTGGFKGYATNSSANWNNGGGLLNKKDFEDYIVAFAAMNGSDRIEMVMRPEIYGYMSRYWQDQVTINDQLPDTVKMHTKSYNIAGITCTLYQERILREYNENTIFVMDASNYFKDKIVVWKGPTGGGEFTIDGTPSWIEKQGENSSTTEEMQFMARIGFQFQGAASGGIALITNVGHNSMS